MGSSRNGYLREEQFRQKMEKRGVLLERPKSFRFCLSTYTPDFYSPSENAYYEVIGTRQRAAHVRMLADLIQAYYPTAILRFVKPDGTRYTFGHQRRVRRWQVPWAESLRQALDQRGWTLTDLAYAIGRKLSTVTGALHTGRSQPTLSAIKMWLDNP